VDKELKYIAGMFISMVIATVLIIALLLHYQKEEEKPREAFGGGQIVDGDTGITYLRYTCWADGSIEIHEIDLSYPITIEKIVDECEQKFHYKYTVQKAVDGEENDF